MHLKFIVLLGTLAVAKAGNIAFESIPTVRLAAPTTQTEIVGPSSFVSTFRSDLSSEPALRLAEAVAPTFTLAAPALTKLEHLGAPTFRLAEAAPLAFAEPTELKIEAQVPALKTELKKAEIIAAPELRLAEATFAIPELKTTRIIAPPERFIESPTFAHIKRGELLTSTFKLAETAPARFVEVKEELVEPGLRLAEVKPEALVTEVKKAEVVPTFRLVEAPLAVAKIGHLAPALSTSYRREVIAPTLKLEEVPALTKIETLAPELKVEAAGIVKPIARVGTHLGGAAYLENDLGLALKLERHSTPLVIKESTTV